MITLGERLRTLIEKRGLEQKEAAELMNLKLSTLNSYIINYRTPDIEMHKKLADFFCVSLDFLTGRTDEHNMEVKKFVKENISLLRGKMSYEELSQDIGKTLNNLLYSNMFTPAYLESLSKGTASPTLQHTGYLAMYAQVDKDFFYNTNTALDLNLAREQYARIMENKKVRHLSERLNSFISDPENAEAIELAMDMVEIRIDIARLRNFIMTTNDFEKYLGLMERTKKKGIAPDDIESFKLKVKI